MPTKKTTKTTAKKAPKKKASKSGDKAALVCANNEECFWTTDGKILSNLVELEKEFDKMSDEVYKYHVTKDKNDFATWVEDILLDAELAASLRKSRKPKTARTVVVRRLKVYDT